ncbi:MAG: HAMP domain-containing sensor histidine kinase, partial [Acidobacteriota bacterium]
PLTGISSYAQMLIDETPDDDPRRRMLEKVERQTFRASQIVNNLLDFARHRHDGMARVDLRQVVTDALSLLDERARRSGAVLDWRLSDEKYPVLGLEGELQQVVTNLVVNALDAMIDQQAERRVRVTVEQAGGRVLCAVSDSGPGIPNERLDTIFKPFFSSKIGRGGTGLGLAISHNIVRRHGGEIAVRNHEDARGCTFTVDLPAADAV